MTDPSSPAAPWDQRYRDGADAWELRQPAPPLERLLRHHALAPTPPATVLVPGCGRGHEAALLADLGFAVTGLDFSAEAIMAAGQRHGAARPELRWLQADLFDAEALAAAGLNRAASMAYSSTPASAPSIPARAGRPTAATPATP